MKVLSVVSEFYPLIKTGGLAESRSTPKARLPTFRDAYRKRRCIVPIDGFFEWKAIKGRKAKQPYAIAMRDGAPLGIAGIVRTKKPRSGRNKGRGVASGAASNE